MALIGIKERKDEECFKSKRREHGKVETCSCFIPLFGFMGKDNG